LRERCFSEFTTRNSEGTNGNDHAAPATSRWQALPRLLRGTPGANSEAAGHGADAGA